MVAQEQVEVGFEEARRGHDDIRVSPCFASCHHLLALLMLNAVHTFGNIIYIIIHASSHGSSYDEAALRWARLSW